MNHVLIVAGEASSALYAQRLLELWAREGVQVKAFGVGSEAMESVGFERLGKSESMAVVGIVEVFSKIREIYHVFYGLLSAAKERKPAFALLLDYPDFNLRLAKKLKKLGIPVVYYISPQVWAWRTSRVHLIKKVVDLMLVLFPFEKEFYDKHNVPVRFVGHPLLDELRPELFDPSYVQMRRSRFGILPGEKVLGLMPGSRNSELKFNLLAQMQTAELLCKKDPQLKVAMLVAPTLERAQIQALLPEYPFPLMFWKEDPMDMVAMTDAVLVASGTATLLVGLMRKPMAIMYKMKPFTAFLAKLFVRSIEHFGMINLILRKKVVPEFFQDAAEPLQLAKALDAFLHEPNTAQQIQQSLSLAEPALGSRGATQRVAKELEVYFRKEK